MWQEGGLTYSAGSWQVSKKIETKRSSYRDKCERERMVVDEADLVLDVICACESDAEKGLRVLDPVPGARGEAAVLRSTRRRRGGGASLGLGGLAACV